MISYSGVVVLRSCCSGRVKPTETKLSGFWCRFVFIINNTRRNQAWSISTCIIVTFKSTSHVASRSIDGGFRGELGDGGRISLCHSRSLTFETNFYQLLPRSKIEIIILFIKEVEQGSAGDAAKAAQWCLSFLSVSALECWSSSFCLWSRTIV